MPRKLLLLILIPLILCPFISNVNAYETNITPLADSRVKHTTPNTNYGDSDILCVSWSAVHSRSFLRFSLSCIPSGMIITSAKLFLRSEHTDGGGTVDLYFVSNDTWGEFIITWNNQPSYGDLLCSKSVTDEYSWYSWAVTQEVRTEYNGDKIISLMLGSSAYLIEFDSKDMNGNDPYLKIRYTHPEEEPEEGKKEGEEELEIIIPNFPKALARKLNISLFAAQLMASTLIMAFCLFPIFILTKGKNIIAVIFVGFASMSICVALLWLPWWILLITGLFVAVMWKWKEKD